MISITNRLLYALYIYSIPFLVSLLGISNYKDNIANLHLQFQTLNLLKTVYYPLNSMHYKHLVHSVVWIIEL